MTLQLELCALPSTYTDSSTQEQNKGSNGLSNTLKSKIHLNNISKLIFYLTENTLHGHQEDQSLNPALGNGHSLLCESYEPQLQ
jgi:hypothetical protein